MSVRRTSLDVADPHPLLRELRQRHAVGAVKVFEALGLRPEREFRDVVEYTAFTYDACREILGDQSRFSAVVNAARYDEMHGGRTIASMDDPEHRTMRGLVSAAFFSHGLEQWARDVVPVVVEEQLDHLGRLPQPVDLVKELAFPVPIQIVVGLLGVPRHDWPQLLEWVDELVHQSLTPEAGLAATAAANRYIADIVRSRRAAPRDDLASALAVAEVDGERLTEQDITAFLVLLLAAGGETTVRTVGTLLIGLLQNPDQLQAIREDRSLLAGAIDEALRWEPPLQMIRRQCRVDTEVAGTPIRAGAHVVAHAGAANRDPARWLHPDDFDVRREFKPNLTFGAGPHYCLGVHLAKREITAVLGAILDRVDGLRLAPGQSAPTIYGTIMRGPRHLWATFDAVHPATAHP